MNGWQRIGVIASVAWFIGMWNHTGHVLDKKRNEIWHSQYQLCRNRPHESARDFEQSNQCGDEASSYADILSYGRSRDELDRAAKSSWALWFAMRNENQIAAALFPIPLFWLAVYICIWLTRWVRRGFQKSAKS